MRWFAATTCFAVLLCAADFAQGSIVVAYRSLNDPLGLSPTESAADVTGSLLTRGSGLAPAGGSTFNSRGWTAASLESAHAEGDYLSWGWSSSPALDLNDLTLRYDRSSSGPSEIAILLATNGSHVFDTVFTDNSVASDSSEWHTIDLSSWQGVTAAEFRLVGWNASRSSGTFDLEDYLDAPPRALSVTAIADPAAVPEPSTLLIWLIPLAGVLIRPVFLAKARSREAAKGLNALT